MNRLSQVFSHLSKQVGSQVGLQVVSQVGSQGYATAAGKGYKVAVLGAAGGIGQPLSLLLKLNPFISELSLYDLMNAPGVTADISHINSVAQVKGYQGEESLKDALQGSDLVIIPAGIPRKPGMSRDDLFNVNASIVQGLVKAIGQYSPGALINIISNPVNSTVPIAAKTLQDMGVYDQRKLFGVSTLDAIRARTFYAELKGLDITQVDVPVVGGHAGVTILPLFSQATPSQALTDEEEKSLTNRVQDGGTEVVNAKAGKGSATLSMAYAGAVFGDACLRGLRGDNNVVECCYVQTDVVQDLPFFATKVKLGKQGIEFVHPVNPMSLYEKESLNNLKPELLASIEKGLNFKGK